MLCLSQLISFLSRIWIQELDNWSRLWRLKKLVFMTSRTFFKRRKKLKLIQLFPLHLRLGWWMSQTDKPLVCTWHVNMAVVTWIPRALCIQWNFEGFNGRRSFRKRPYFHLKFSKTLFNGKRPSKFHSHRKYLVCGPSHNYVFLHIGLNLRLLAKAFYAFKDEMGLDGNVG